MSIRSMLGYLLVSCSCWLLNNAILIVMDRAGAPLAASVALSFAICVVVGYVLHGRVSFRSQLEVAAFARYVAAISVNIPCVFVTLWLWRDLLGLRMEVAAPCATAATTLVNFVLCRFAVFGERAAAGA